MEDRAFVSILCPGVCFCGVLDGHGGRKAVDFWTEGLSKWLRDELSKIAVPTLERVKNAVEEVFLDSDKQWYDQNCSTSGTTFTGVLIFSKEKVVYLINLGDSRTVLFLDRKIISSKDHKPSNPSEEERVGKAGGYVSWNRVDGILAVSRALGDIDFKGISKYKGREAKVSPVPDVTEYPFSKDTKIIMASDGLFDKVEDNSMILRYFDEYEEDPCDELMRYAAMKGSMDNIIIMMLDLSLQKE